jgi:hypothetical protein
MNLSRQSRNRIRLMKQPPASLSQILLMHSSHKSLGQILLMHQNHKSLGQILIMHQIHKSLGQIRLMHKRRKGLNQMLNRPPKALSRPAVMAARQRRLAHDQKPPLPISRVTNLRSIPAKARRQFEKKLSLLQMPKSQDRAAKEPLSQWSHFQSLLRGNLLCRRSVRDRRLRSRFRRRAMWSMDCPMTISDVIKCHCFISLQRRVLFFVAHVTRGQYRSDS